MALESIDDIRDWLKASYRPWLYQDLYNSLLWLTNADEINGFEIGANEFPVWPMLRPRRVFANDEHDLDRPTPETRIRDTYNNVTLLTTKLRSSAIKPKYLDIRSNITTGARTEYWRKRCTGSAQIPGWNKAIGQFAFDGALTGLGVLQIGKRKNIATGKTIVTVKRHRPLNVLTDPYADTVSSSERMAVCHIMPVEYAQRYTGIPDLSGYTEEQGYWEFVSGGRKVCQVFEYFSYSEDADPTRMLSVGSFHSEAFKIMPNNFECLPFATNEFMYVDGYEMPQGAVYLQAELEMQADSWRKRVAAIADAHGFRVLNQDGISRKDIAQVKAALDGKGKMPRIVLRRTKLDNKVAAVEVVQGDEIPEGTMEMLQMMIGELRAISGINDARRGQSISGEHTLGEAEIIDQQSDGISGQAAWATAQGMQMCIQKVGLVARQFDDDPLYVAGDWGNALINDPEDPAMAASELFAEDSIVEVAEDELFGATHDRKTERKIAVLFNNLKLPGANLPEISKEILRLQELDPNQFMMQMQPAVQPGMTPAAPGQPGEMPVDPRDALQGALPQSL